MNLNMPNNPGQIKTEMKIDIQTSRILYSIFNISLTIVDIKKYGISMINKENILFQLDCNLICG